ncbi:MAG: hypothetical protein COX32_04445, partial [Candidatus Moranbacteria bacterium CG23_combo_of_CG06-09_8_20_14_all_41_28]
RKYISFYVAHYFTKYFSEETLVCPATDSLLEVFRSVETTEPCSRKLPSLSEKLFVNNAVNIIVYMK